MYQQICLQLSPQASLNLQAAIEASLDGGLGGGWGGALGGGGHAVFPVIFSAVAVVGHIQCY